MSVDLDFWKYKPGVDHDDQRVYEALSDGETLADVQELPIEEIRAPAGSGRIRTTARIRRERAALPCTPLPSWSALTAMGCPRSR